MKADLPDPLDEWIQSRREQPAPELSHNFAQRVMRVLDSPTPVASALVTIAALVAVALVGFLRMELITLLLFNSAAH